MCASACASSAPTPELGHTRTPRALLIRPFLCATSPCATRVVPLPDAPFWTRQYARAFNQPLSFDTPSVTDMRRMFNVRASACAFCPL